MGFFSKRRQPSVPSPGQASVSATDGKASLEPGPDPSAASDSAPGWEAIDAAMASLYGTQRPRHVAPSVPPIFSGKGDAWGISSFDAGSHWHFVTYGLTELFSKERDDLTVSGMGYELTLRLVKDGAEAPGWAFSELNYLVQMINAGSIDLWVGDRLDRGAPLSQLHDDMPATELQVWFVVQDPQLGQIQTPHGAVEFRQVVGMTAAERDAAKASSNDVVLAGLRGGNPLLMTDITRASSA